MRFFLALLRRSRIFLLFLLLEGLAFTLIFSHRSYQRATLLSSTNRVVGEFLSDYNDLTRYFQLEIENEHLARQNTRLQNLLDRSVNFQRFGADTINDSLIQQRYTIVQSRVINSSHAKRRNYITLDKGAMSGLKRGMGVSGPNGAVGMIEAVSDHFSSVIPLINPRLSITGKLKRTGHFGPLKWDGTNYLEARLEDIPRYADIREGDSVVTDARSAVFPEGLMLGTVTGKTLQDDQNFFSLNVALNTDFSKLEHVYVIKDRLRQELDSLQNQQEL